ncbi:MAG: hypothetical protein HOC24_02525 [Deltaproteobacteria bacterium]|jgi:hypothetical protein|nr:hypothetical protein [Deltaproteobacteria bacterium]
MKSFGFLGISLPLQNSSLPKKILKNAVKYFDHEKQLPPAIQGKWGT